MSLTALQHTHLSESATRRRQKQPRARPLNPDVPIQVSKDGKPSLDDTKGDFFGIAEGRLAFVMRFTAEA